MAGKTEGGGMQAAHRQIIPSITPAITPNNHTGQTFCRSQLVQRSRKNPSGKLFHQSHRAITPGNHTEQSIDGPEGGYMGWKDPQPVPQGGQMARSNRQAYNKWVFSAMAKANNPFFWGETVRQSKVKPKSIMVPPRGIIFTHGRHRYTRTRVNSVPQAYYPGARLTTRFKALFSRFCLLRVIGPKNSFNGNLQGRAIPAPLFSIIS
jgi:hypothetical protein